MNKRQAAAAFLLYRGQNQGQRYWVHPINSKCEESGEFNTLYKDLWYPDRFHTYYHMSLDQFDYILQSITL